MHSAIYHGQLRHRRFEPHPHAFSYALFCVYLDLAEIDRVFRGRWLWSTRRGALARFDRRDHLGDPQRPLDECVRELVEARTGVRPTGPIRLLTHLRYFGYCFNPVSFFYCFDPADTRIEAVVAEVNNTPWGERHCYVLHAPERTTTARWQRYRTPKELHVSPFMPMALEYQWGFSAPGPRLAVHMALHRSGDDRVFDATLTLERRPISGAALARTLLRFPFMTARVIGAIYWQALRLWLKRTPTHAHPSSAAAGRPGAMEHGT